MNNAPRLTLLPILGAFMLTGCNSNPDAAKYAHATAMAYYQQANTAPILQVRTQEGGKAVWEVSGPAEVTLGTPVPPKNIIPRDPSVLNTAIEWAGRLGLAWFVSDAFVEATRTRIVNQPEPIIVEQPGPEIIEVPAF